MKMRQAAPIRRAPQASARPWFPEVAAMATHDSGARPLRATARAKARGGPSALKLPTAPKRMPSSFTSTASTPSTAARPGSSRSGVGA